MNENILDNQAVLLLQLGNFSTEVFSRPKLCDDFAKKIKSIGWLQVFKVDVSGDRNYKFYVCQLFAIKAL